MKKLIVVSFVLLTGCDPIKPDYVDKNGKEYLFSHPCVKSHTETDYGYHYNYNIMSGKYDWHYGMDTETICDSVGIDTIEINQDKKYYAKK